jgi:hypothetical protein
MRNGSNMINQTYHDVNLIAVSNTEVAALLEYLPWSRYMLRKLRKTTEDTHEIEPKISKLIALLSVIEAECRGNAFHLSVLETTAIQKYRTGTEFRCSTVLGYGLVFGFSAEITKFLEEILPYVNLEHLTTTLNRRLPGRFGKPTLLNTYPISTFLTLLTKSKVRYLYITTFEREALNIAFASGIFESLIQRPDKISSEFATLLQPWVAAVAKNYRVRPAWVEKYLRLPKVKTV